MMNNQIQQMPQGGRYNMPNVGVGGYQVPQVAPRQRQQQRALVGFGQVPKFVPPSYDGVHPGDLPCPETPSPRGSIASSNGGNNNNDHMNDNRHPAVVNSYAGKSLEQGGNRNQTSRGGRQTSAGGVVSVHKKGELSTPAAPFPPGAFVEYRSRTMQDRWILAKVEAFDDKNKVYKLDVQPKAPMDRVRLRSMPDEEPAPRPEPPAPPEPVAQPQPALKHQETHIPVLAPVEPPPQQQEISNGQPGGVAVAGLHDVLDPYEQDGGPDYSALSREELVERMESALSENENLKRQLNQKDIRIRELEAQLRR